MSIPKKPLAVSRAKKKLPVELDWGPGVPKDRLAYINAHEEALIKRFRKTKAARDYAGIPSYADDSASSKGVERGADGPSGVGRGSGSGGGVSSTKSGSTSTSKTSSGGSANAASGSKPASGQSAASSMPSKAPNAAAQAASNRLNGVSAAPVSRVNASTAPIGSSRAPNAAAAYASSKLNATAGALKSAQQPQSIQSMINAGQIAPNGSYYGPKGISGLNASAYGAATRSAQTAPNGSYYGPKGTTSLNQDARYAAARSVGFNPDPVKRTPGDAEAMGRMMMAESATIKNKYGNPSVPGLMGVGEVIRNRMLSERFPDTVPAVMSQRKQFSPMGDGSYAKTPANDVATRIAESILSGESPHTVGTALNYGNIDTINNKPGYSSKASKAAFNSMPVEARIADARNPNTFSHSFGTIGAPSDVAFNGTGAASIGLAAAPRPSEPAAPRPQSIPSPTGMSMLPQAQRAQTQVVTDPRVGMNMSASAAPAEPETPPGYFSQFAMTDKDIANLKTQAVKDFGFSDLMQMQKNISALPGFMGPITRDQQRVASLAAQPAPAPSMGTQVVTDPRVAIGLPSNGPTRLAAGNPDTYQPQSAPEDVPVYSENPMQGSQNPMQEGPQVEDPAAVKQRQQKYAGRGATIGSVIAGPLGAIVGGTLGWQMGKTSPQQRQAIASNPQALNANVQSINTMVEERGGKGNPQMRVTDKGLKDVLTNPARVTQNPEQYTTLEQMLAALAQGIDPETGKPIT